jgi:predicted nucleic acid-binding protein
VLVYAHDPDEGAKYRLAMAALDGLQATGHGCLSVQCLSEFVSATIRGPRPRLSVLEAEREIERFTQSWRVLSITPPIVLEAVRGVRVHRLAFWDAQLWATARLNQIPTIFSEDFASRVLEGVRFVNPFAAGFDLEAWV